MPFSRFKAFLPSDTHTGVSLKLESGRPPLALSFTSVLLAPTSKSADVSLLPGLTWQRVKKLPAICRKICPESQFQISVTPEIIPESRVQSQEGPGHPHNTPLSHCRSVPQSMLSSRASHAYMWMSACTSKIHSYCILPYDTPGHIQVTQPM